MLAAVYHGPRDLRVEDRPIPAIGARELLLRIDSTSLCATDFRIFDGSHRMYGPGTIRVPGHEMVGTIAELGREVKGLSIGQRVFIAPNMGCGQCRQCRRGQNNLCADYDAFGITLDGAFAEYMKVTASALEQGNVIPLPSDIDSASLALCEPFACVLHGQDAVQLGEHDAVLILGAGPIGLMHVLLARWRGAHRIIVSDQTAERLEKAREFGADRVVNFLQEDIEAVVAEETQGLGVDVVIVAAPVHAAQQQAPRMAAIGGRINYFAGLPKERPTIELNSNLLHYKELILTGTTACSTSDCQRAVQLVTSGRVTLSGLISQRLPLASATQAFAMARDGKHLKVVLQP